MANKIYVGNLSYQTTEGDLETELSKFGALVSVVVIKDRDTGRSKGFGFVEFENKDDMDKAISEMDGKDFDGRPLRVNVAQERKERSGGGGGRRRDW